MKDKCTLVSVIPIINTDGRRVIGQGRRNSNLRSKFKVKIKIVYP